MSQPHFIKSEYESHLAEHRLMGSRCQTCGSVFLPPRPLCSNCYGEKMEWVDMGESGTLVAFTVVHIAPTAMIEAGYGRDNPYVTGIVTLDSGPSISAQIIGVDAKHPETIVIGSPVVARFIARQNGDGQQPFLVFELIS
ncbi:MAG: Zn-ribbon domain-containing OB-fold protein [Caldilineales bacterium]|nr:Zn-ribbon domain-containing OB-fold protein [Caldilineales bacterium]